MQSMVPLKKNLSSKDIVYIYLTGPSSPENIWKSNLSKMTGVHYRLTDSQWKYLCTSYGVTGIPAYLIISHDGKLQGRYVGFPGRCTAKGPDSCNRRVRRITDNFL